MHALALLPGLFSAALSLISPQQMVFRPAENHHQTLILNDCVDDIPKANVPDCQALLSTLGERGETDHTFCGSICGSPDGILEQQGVAITNGTCELQLVTNIIGGPQSPCDAW
jgi:hypothetical protein